MSESFKLTDIKFHSVHNIWNFQVCNETIIIIKQQYFQSILVQKMFEFYIALIDKNEGYLAGVQRYVSRYINEDASNNNNIAFTETCFSVSKRT